MDELLTWVFVTCLGKDEMQRDRNIKLMKVFTMINCK